MNWSVGFQEALDYVEEHLTEEIDVAEAARRAACSEFWFQRIFGVVCGMTLGEYVRNRRLTLAGGELSSGDRKVIDVALKYGYESPESFARAFSGFHGVTPSQAKKKGTGLKSFSRLSVNFIWKGGHIMNYKIVKKSAFTLLQRVERHSVDDSLNRNSIPEFWTRVKEDGTVGTLLENAEDKTFLFGVCYGNDRSDEKTFEYAIGVCCRAEGEAPAGFKKREIPAGEWAVFGCVGAMPDAVQQTWHKICSEFFPLSGYQPTYEMDIEAYPDGDMNSSDYSCEIWVPVKKSTVDKP